MVWSYFFHQAEAAFCLLNLCVWYSFATAQDSTFTLQWVLALNDTLYSAVWQSSRFIRPDVFTHRFRPSCLFVQIHAHNFKLQEFRTPTGHHLCIITATRHANDSGHDDGWSAMVVHRAERSLTRPISLQRCHLRKYKKRNKKSSCLPLRGCNSDPFPPSLVSAIPHNHD